MVRDVVSWRVTGQGKSHLSLCAQVTALEGEWSSKGTSVLGNYRLHDQGSTFPGDRKSMRLSRTNLERQTERLIDSGESDLTRDALWLTLRKPGEIERLIDSGERCGVAHLLLCTF